MSQPQVHMCAPILNPLPPPSPPLPSGLSQSTGFEFPASCIELALVIYKKVIIILIMHIDGSPSPLSFHPPSLLTWFPCGMHFPLGLIHLGLWKSNGARWSEGNLAF